MAKTTTTVSGTKYDPMSDVNNDLARLGLTAEQEVNKFGIISQADRLNSFSNVDVNQFKPDTSLLESDANILPRLEEQRAREQGVVNQLAKGVGRIGSTILTEILKSPGYIGGALGSSLIEGDFIENTVNNAWVNAFENLDETLKEAMPVYLQKDVQEGNIGRKLLSSAWWATTGADGIGFLLSMYAPGQAMKAIGVGNYLAKGLEGVGKIAGAESKFAKAMTAANLLRETQAGLKATTKAIEGANSIASVALNTYIESASEAANTFDNVKKNFLAANPDATDEQANQEAGKAASSVMKANIALLSVSNLLDEIFLFKGFGRSAEKVASESIIGKLFKDGHFSKEAISQLKKKGIKEFAKEALPKLVSNFAKEGLFEEGLQTKIQQHYEDVSSGKTKAGFWDDVVGGYFDSLMNDPEMQESVVLGGILGGGASMVEAGNSISHYNRMLFGSESKYPSFLAKVLNRKEKTESPGLIKILDDNFVNSFRTIHDVAERDADGNIVTRDGRVSIDEAKLKEMIEQKQNVVTLNQLHNLAILEGNKSEEEMYSSQLAFNYFLPFLQQEGGYEVLQQHIESQLVDLMAKKVEDATGVAPSERDREGIKAKLVKKAKEFNDVYQDVDTTTNTELYVRPRDKNYGSWKNSVKDRKMQALITYNSATRALQEFDTSFPTNITDEEFQALSPQEALQYNFIKKYRQSYADLATKAKEKYQELSSKKGLQADYESYNKEIADVQEAVVAEANETVQEAERVDSSQSYEKIINDQGYETLNNPDVKGFYLKDERVVVQNSKGERGVLQSIYDPKAKRSDLYFINKQGQSTRITDDNGVISDTFLKSGFRPISKQQLTTERKAFAIEQRKKAQLTLLQEFIDARTAKLNNKELEIQDIEKQIADYETQLEKAKTELAELYNNRVSNKAKNLRKKQLKIQEKTLLNTIDNIENTINNLKARRDDLYELLPKIEAVRQEYIKLKELVEQEGTISFKQELAKAEQALVSDQDTKAIQDLITDLQSKIEHLERVRDSIRKVLAANKALIRLITLSEKEYTKAFRAFDKFFEGVPFPNDIARIHQLATQDLSETIAGETLAKNNIITNAVSIAEWFNANQGAREAKFGTSEPITEEDVYNKVIDILKPYSDSMENLPITPEELYDLQSKVFITNREIDNLKKELIDNEELLKTTDLYRRYKVLSEIVQERFEKRYNELRNEQAERTLDNSQKQRGSYPEQQSEVDMRDIFYKHALSTTPYATTGLSVLYNKEGDRKGKDQIDENGFPVLNDNEFQRLWFLVTDKLSDEISEYMLMPVKANYSTKSEGPRIYIKNKESEVISSEDELLIANAKIEKIISTSATVEEARDRIRSAGFIFNLADSQVLNEYIQNRIDNNTIESFETWRAGEHTSNATDEFQRAIEANFPNEDQRSDNDVFVFLVDKTGKPVRADRQGNLLKEGGTFVFSSLRKADEVFPAGKNPRIAPDYILEEYLQSLGITVSFKYDKIRDQKVSQFAFGKTKDKLKHYIDNDATGEQLFQDAIKYAKQNYETFLQSLESAKGFLEIENTTRGYHLYQVDKNGKRIRNKPLDVFKGVTLQKNNVKSDQLQGAKLGISIKSSVQSKGQLIDLPAGTVYMMFPNEEFVTLQSRNINDDEAKTVMYLLSMADTAVPLNTINIPFPKNKEGKQYYYYFNGKRIEETLPVFARRLPSGEPFSLLHTIINYGFKSEGKNKKGEIYIQSGKVHYTTFDGKPGEVTLKEISEAVKSDNFNNYNDSVKNLFEFLLQKRFNVEKNLFQSNGIFMYPKLKKLSKGQYQIDFDTSNTYHGFLLGNVLTTSATRKEGYPDQLQRNIVFKPSVVSKPTPKTEMKVVDDKPVAQAPAKVDNANSTTNAAKISWLQQKRINISKAGKSIEASTSEKEAMFYKPLDGGPGIIDTLKQQASDLGVTITDAEINELYQIFLNGYTPEQVATQTADDLLNKAKPKQEPVEAPKKSAKERLAELQNKPKIELTPRNTSASLPDADKVANVNELLDDYVEQNIVQKNCK